MSLTAKYMPGATCCCISIVSTYGQQAGEDWHNEQFYFCYKKSSDGTYQEVLLTPSSTGYVNNELRFENNSWKASFFDLEAETSYNVYIKTEDGQGAVIDSTTPKTITTCALGEWAYHMGTPPLGIDPDYTELLEQMCALPVQSRMVAIGYHCGDLDMEIRYNPRQSTAGSSFHGRMDFGTREATSDTPDLMETFCHEGRHYHGIVGNKMSLAVALGYCAGITTEMAQYSAAQAEKVYRFQCCNDSAYVMVYANHSNFIDFSGHLDDFFVLKGLRGYGFGVTGDENSITIVE